MWKQFNDQWVRLEGKDVFYSHIWRAVVIFIADEKELFSDFLPKVLAKNCPIYIFLLTKERNYIKAKEFVHFPQCFNNDLSIDLNKIHGNCVVSENSLGAFWILDALFSKRKTIDLPRKVNTVKKLGGVIKW